MTQREQMLAIVVGVLFTLVLGYLGISFWSGAVTRRNGEIATLEKRLLEQEKLVRETTRAQARIKEYENRSLPPQRDLARSQYQAWLLERVNAAKLEEPNVQFESPRNERDFYTMFTFRITGKGNLQQIVQLLHEFYSVDLAHRVSRLSLHPIPDSKLINFGMTVEALSMSGAPESSELVLRPAQRLALPTREGYYTAILERNIFGAPNRKPRVSETATGSGETGRPVDISIDGSDPDPGDKLTFRLEKSDVREARLDPATGKLNWTPRRPGSYEFSVAVADDGIPSRSVTQRLVVTVTDPAPTAPPVRTLAFDEAKYTTLSGVTEVNGVSQVWLRNKPAGKILKLKVGDEFEIGSVKGTIKSIGPDEFLFESDGKLKKLVAGGILEQAEVTGP